MATTGASTTQQIFQDAQHYLAGGVSASMRLNPYLGKPLYLTRGDGPYIYGQEDERYIDFNLSNGAALLGHNIPEVTNAVMQAIQTGLLAGAETVHNLELAKRLVEIIPSAERVRFATVGTEATVLALRIARHTTGRTKYLKFDGHFHGLAEQWLYKRADEFGPCDTVEPASGGVPADGAEVIMVPWNDEEAYMGAMDKYGDQLAAVICEPVFYNSGCIPPREGFLELLRSSCTGHGVVLIFDEILSGFRTCIGGIQAETGIMPDLSTHAKAMANGYPISSISGREDLMETLAPNGPVAHSGTYSGHNLSVLAALATLDLLSGKGVYDGLNANADSFYASLQGIFDRHDVPVRVQGRGARFGIYFGVTTPVETLAQANQHDHHLNRIFHDECVARGVYFHPYKRAGAPGHAGISLSHSREVLEDALDRIDEATRVLREQAEKA